MDASVLTHVVRDAKGPVGIDRLTERVEYLLETLAHEKAVIVIPTPSLAEVLVRAGPAGPELLTRLGQSRHFKIAPFDTLAAVEHAALVEERLALNARLSREQRAKAKFDEQIVSIASVNRADVIYSDDSDIRQLAAVRFRVVGLAELPLAPEDPQAELPLDP